MAGRNPEEPDPLEVIIDLYTDSETAPNVADQVRARPIEGIAFAIGAAMGPISNARRLFADREWTTAELMRMERDMNECIGWALTFRKMIQGREGWGTVHRDGTKTYEKADTPCFTCDALDALEPFHHGDAGRVEQHEIYGWGVPVEGLFHVV